MTIHQFKNFSSFISSFAQQMYVDSHREPKYFQGTRDTVVNRAEKILTLIDPCDVVGRNTPENTT